MTKAKDIEITEEEIFRQSKRWEKDPENEIRTLLSYDAIKILDYLEKKRKDEKEEAVNKVINIAKTFMADEVHKEFEEKVSKRLRT